MATQKSLPFGTTNTTDDVVLITASIAGGANETVVFDNPFESAPDVLSAVSQGAVSAVVTCDPTATDVDIYVAGAGGAETVTVMLRGKLASTSDKIS